MTSLVTLVVVALALSPSPVRGESDTTAVLWVDGIPVVLAEVRPLVADPQSVHGAGQVATALDQLVDVKVQYLLAVEHGLIHDARWTAIEEARREENRLRRLAVDRHDVVYGPVEFSTSAFAEYYLGRLAARLKEIIAEPSTDLSEQRLRRVYDARREQLFRRPDNVTVLTVTPHPGDENALERLRSALAATDDGDSLRFVAPCRVRPVTIDERARRRLGEEQALFLQAALELEPGQIVEGPGEDGGWALIKCMARTPAGYLSFDEARDIVRSRLIDETYTTLVRRRRNATRIEVNTRVLEQITTEFAGSMR